MLFNFRCQPLCYRVQQLSTTNHILLCKDYSANNNIENYVFSNPSSKIDEKVENVINESSDVKDDTILKTIKDDTFLDTASPTKANSTSIPFSESEVTISDFIAGLSSSLTAQILQTKSNEPHGDPSSETTTSGSKALSDVCRKISLTCDSIMSQHAKSAPD